MQRNLPRRHHDFCAQAAVLMIAWFTLLGCGATLDGGAQEPSRADEAIDADTLNAQAGSLLLAALHDSDTARQGLLELRMAGAAALPWVERALESDDDHASPAISESVRAELLSVLASRGDADAIKQLVDSSSNDPIAIACRIAVLDPADRVPELRADLQHSSERVRSAALQRLRNTTLTAELLLDVTERARIDPAPSVRADALQTLATQGSAAIDVLEARLLDPDPLPRAVAMRALARLDCTHAHGKLAHWLSGAPSRDGLAATRALTTCGDAMIATTLDHLRRALATTDAGLRAEAATTADAVAWVTLPEWIATPLAHDPVPAVRLALALAVQPTHPAAAHATLAQLADGAIAMVSVQAAAILAVHGDANATTVLRSAIAQRDAKLRRVALVALARVPGQAAEVTVGLRDPDISVRLATAGALLRMTHSML